MIRKLAMLTAAAGLLSACATVTEPPSPGGPALRPSTLEAIAAADVAGLLQSAADAHPSERALARGVELSWRRQDAAALASLRDARRLPGQSDVKAQAAMMQMAVLMRQGEYAASANAAREAAALDPSMAEDGAPAIALMEALKGEKPTRAVGEAKGRAPLARDMVKLPRADIEVNGVSQAAVLDTGAGFSTIMESAAVRLGLRRLDGQASVGTTVMASLGTKLAVADRLRIGGAEFSDVVFMVLPDEALTMLNGSYKIEAILGMPVFLEMGRIAFEKDAAGAEWFAFGRGGAPLETEPNLLMAAMAPLAEAVVDPSGQAKGITLLLDSGANATTLNGRFAVEFAALLEGAEETRGQVGGAGGVMRDVQHRRIKEIVMLLGGRRMTLGNLDVSGEGSGERHGILGQDVLGVGFVVDFDEMKLLIAP